MYYPTENSTKDTMLLYVQSKGAKTARQLAKRINCNALADYEVSETGSLDEILSELKPISKAVLWSEIIKICPELLDSEQEEEENEEHDCGEFDGDKDEEE